MANAAEFATQVAAVAQAAQDPSLIPNPVLTTLLIIVSVVVAAIAIGVPIKDYLRRDKRETGVDQVAYAVAGAGAGLYQHLASQLTQYREISDRAFAERNLLIERVARLEERDAQFDELKTSYTRLKERLDEKDRKLEEKDEELRRILASASDERNQFLEIIRRKDTDIISRDERILKLEEGHRALELRLVQEENQLKSFVCPFTGRDKLRRSNDIKGDSNETGQVPE